jgi:hypothetical protein
MCLYFFYNAHNNSYEEIQAYHSEKDTVQKKEGFPLAEK